MLEGLLSLGTRVIIIAFTSLNNLPDLKNDWLAWTTSEQITGQAFLRINNQPIRLEAQLI